MLGAGDGHELVLTTHSQRIDESFRSRVNVAFPPLCLSCLLEPFRPQLDTHALQEGTLGYWAVCDCCFTKRGRNVHELGMHKAVMPLYVRR